MDMPIILLQGLLARTIENERRIAHMTTALEALTAAEAKLEQVVAAIIADNQKHHAELAAALAASGGVDEAAVQAVAEKLAAQTEVLQGIIAPVPADSDGGSPDPSTADTPAADGPVVDPAPPTGQ